MKENKYDNETFYSQYSQMLRSVKGLEGAGEWHLLKSMLPDFKGKRVLDLGGGFGWHCRYAVDHGAIAVTGVDISARMLAKAREINDSPLIEYICMPIEEFTCIEESYDIVISSLTLHYVTSFEEICRKVHHCLNKDGWFIFSVEHPVFTASGTQEWYTDDHGKCLHWPVDNYFKEGKRIAVFLGEEVVKYHKTLTTYLNGLLKNGFEIREIIEPTPQEALLETFPEMQDELRRPMMLLVSAQRSDNRIRVEI